jgi:hypothetical protein
MPDDEAQRLRKALVRALVAIYEHNTDKAIAILEATLASSNAGAAP